MARLYEQVKVINYRLIEEISQTFNGGLFLPYCSSIIKAFEQSMNFHFKMCLREMPRKGSKEGQPFLHKANRSKNIWPL